MPHRIEVDCIAGTQALREDDLSLHCRHGDSHMQLDVSGTKNTKQQGLDRGRVSKDQH